MYNLVFWPACFLSWLLFGWLFRLKVSGLENIPAGGAIIAPNHQSVWDIPLIGLALCGRRVHFMAKSELFQNPVFGWLIRTLLAFPVKRGTPDRTAIRNAIELLKQEELVVVFPEGTRRKNGELGKPEAGLSLIAAKAGVPIIPVGIIGTRKIFSRNCPFPVVEIHFGKPVCYKDSEAEPGVSPVDIGSRVMESIRCLIKS